MVIITIIISSSFHRHHCQRDADTWCVICNDGAPSAINLLLFAKNSLPSSHSRFIASLSLKIQILSKYRNSLSTKKNLLQYRTEAFFVLNKSQDDHCIVPSFSCSVFQEHKIFYSSILFFAFTFYPIIGQLNEYLLTSAQPNPTVESGICSET